ncbi:hypothetical protein DFJ63DRAFT_283621 [Scheffersomyces coipomensis]|uniref:uncharacterized protein n=1 Tax=Scheffersomyces coipomensis TaxID=1788519 RepID=UPI00315E016C
MNDDNDEANTLTPDHLKIQINDYDTYQTFPSRLDHLYNKVTQVPIIRIYGSVNIPFATKNTDTVSNRHDCFNVLIHIHNYYPYIYVDCFETNYDLLKDPNYLNQIIDHLETNLSQSFKRRKKNKDDDDDDDDEEDAVEDIDENTLFQDKRRRFIAHLSVVKATPIYGFQLGYKLVFKISLLSPKYKTRLNKLIYEKSIDFNKFYSSTNAKRSKTSNKVHLIYEGHIPYLLQFLTDFNLFGCGWLYANNSFGLYFRNPIFSSSSSFKNVYPPLSIDRLKEYLRHFITSRNLLITPERIGKSILEIDISQLSIIRNRTEVQSSSSKNISNRLHANFNELLLFNNNLNNLHSFKANTYKYDETGNKRIYLSSLKHIYEDLKYQYLSRNDITASAASIFNDSLSSESISASNSNYDSNTIANAYFGMGATEWSNQLELNDLLAYVKKLNNSIDSNLSVINYGKTHFEINNIKLRNFKTAYEQIDFEINGSIGSNNLTLQFEKDILQWNDFLKLFEIEDSSISSFTVASDVKDSNDDNRLMVSTDLDMILDPDNNYYEIQLPLGLSKSNIDKEFDDLGILKINYQDPYYDKESDMPNRPLIFANKKIVIPLVNDSTIPALPMSSMILGSIERQEESKSIEPDSINDTSRWECIIQPPSKESMNAWIVEQKMKSVKKSRKILKSQFELKSEDNDFKFSYNSEKIKRNNDDGFNSLTNFCLEIHVNTIDEKLPNPLNDKVTFVIYMFDDSNGMFEGHAFKSGILLLSDDSESESRVYDKLSKLLNTHSHIEVFNQEVDLVNRLVQIIEIFDPDILSGYEINALSWGYLIERFRVVHDINLLASFSRGDYKSNGKLGDRWGYTHTSNIKINGRHMVNVWRLMRSELSLTNYSLENISYHLLHQSLPRYSNLQLSTWLNDTTSNKLAVLKYYSKRLSLIIKLIEVQELITKNVEYSRLIGIDFNSNFYRGSQFKIESILLRITKFENIILNSPSKQQVHEMRPIECIPLIMEPDSNFYKSPLVVLDFQSLYPSIMIAYNYCFSTLLGKLHNFKSNKNNIGYLKNLNLNPGLVDFLIKQDGINISPNGFMFVKSNIRKSILAKMLEEILDTRILVKLIMKEFKDDSELVKLYNSRQLALKLIANVTYGYTSATFSGRMPNSDVSDAIVSTGREILTKSIELIENNDFGGKVVYGDTDSLFVYFPGKSKAEAFKLGREIAEFITNQFPNPIKLKFEKVYHPCVLLTKKRYVGYMYEYEDQVVPKFDAKGIETIRRDGIPAQSKIVEKSLRILFETKNLSRVKQYVTKQFYKISMNKISINDFCFAKEVRYGTYKNEMYLPPGAIVAAKKVEQDARQEPQYRERVPYVVIQDSTKPRIKDRCMSPQEFIESYSNLNPYVLDYEYYITRVLIPPLERIFNLIGVDIKSWYRELPKLKFNNLGSTNNLFKMTNFINVNNCLNCGKELNSNNQSNSKYFCIPCRQHELTLITNLTMELKFNEISLFNLNKLCQLCVKNNFINNGSALGIDKLNQLSNQCCNSSCKVYYDKFKVKNINLQLSKRNENIMEEFNNW